MQYMLKLMMLQVSSMIISEKDIFQGALLQIYSYTFIVLTNLDCCKKKKL